MSETLEAMARALFKSWFVDLEQEAHRVNHAKDWPETTLSEFAKLNPESWSKEGRPDVIRYVDLANTKWGRIEEIVDHARASAPSRAQRIVRPGDTIVGTVRPGNGSYAMVMEEGLTVSTGFAVLRPLQSNYREFVYLAATMRENVEALSQLADGGAYPAVRPDVVAATPLVRPPESTLIRFSELVKPMLDRAWQAKHQSRPLAALRDTLLSKLVSGEASNQGRGAIRG